MNSGIQEIILDVLEAHEDPLLSWGVVDGGFTYDELHVLVSHVLLSKGQVDSADDAIEELNELGLITQDTAASPPKWRTRNGEALRLLARLRQIFLSDNPEQAWRQGPSLISDFRYARRPRAYPRRDQPWESVLEGLYGIDDVSHGVIATMTSRKTAHVQLSGFQVRASRHIMTALQSGITTATVVGAGTGSGKTLSFYLPAFAHLAALRDSAVWTRALAVYPRNELLKDQLNTAFAHARRLDQIWTATNGRPMTIGVLNKDTPHSTSTLSAPYSWIKHAQGYECPHFTCPGDGHDVCGGTLYWSEQDVKGKKERLTCSACSRVLDGTVLVLTRQRMSEHPPDILFTTTESLNRGLSDLSLRRLFGVGVTKPPHLMLLDEIHTYSGTSGAQAALVLRRWHHSLRSPVTFVGLSATLSNPVRHMADLTGVENELVVSVEPRADEIEYEGAEYMIAVRSDPTSGASVLSTTIQTAMLLPRFLDDPASRISKGVLGTKTFVFTDDLDVTNRLYSYLLDAEGQRYGKGRTQQFKAPLASMRRPGQAGLDEQRRAGQVWDLPIKLGHKIDGDGLKVSRTTSQDAGVNAESQLVVATASLEVGYDDPDVGGVLQHKAPRGVAAFLQRKGRAGRNRGMRPYTIVVLSDYGRDRATYEAWDALFDPVLPELVLPIRNRAVLRMQATLAMLDWLAERLHREHPNANLWRDLKSLADSKYPGYKETQRVQRTAAKILQEVLRDPGLQRSLRVWVQGALQISENIAAEILWHPPRPLMLAAVPTLARRLSNNWAVATADQYETGKDTMGGNPLPDYFPMNLFSELALPEGQVIVPPQNPGERPEVLAMGMAQMLREYAPGRVSRRFATRNLEKRHWIPISYDTSETVLDLAPVLPPTPRRLETAFVELHGQPVHLPVIRPDQIQLKDAPKDIKDSSNATMVWRTQLIEHGTGLVARIPRSDTIGVLIEEARFFLHAQNAHVEARRVAVESEATVVIERRGDARVRAQFALGDELVGLGATYDVDGLRLTVALPATIVAPASLEPTLLSAWFQYLVTHDEELLRQINQFQLGWLHQALDCMLLMSAVTEVTPLPHAYQTVRSTFAERLTDTLNAMFRSTGVDDSDDTVVSRMAERLQELLADENIVARLDHLTAQVWNPPADKFQAWLRQRALATLGQAALWAAREICPEHDPEGILVDIEPGYDLTGTLRDNEVWLTESSIGGGGFIEALATRVRPDPRRFLRLMMRAIQPSTSELVDTHMRRIVHYATDRDDWRGLVADFRGAQTQAERVTNLNRIRAQLRHAGIYGAEQAVISSLANRLLRPGSTAATDWALRELTDEWEAQEQRLGMEIAPRTWAYLMRKRCDLDTGLNLSTNSSERQRIDAIQSILWPRGWAIRSDTLQSWNPYAENLPAAPDLMRGVLTGHTDAIDITADDADKLIRSRLAERGLAQVTATPEQAPKLADMLVDLSIRAIETEFLQVYPRAVEIDHRPDGSVTVSLELAEVSV